MKAIVARMAKLLRDENGAETLEWAMIGCLLVIGAIAAMSAMSGWMKGRWTSIEAAQP